MVRETLQELPGDLRAALSSVEIVVKEEPGPLRSGGKAPSEDLFGLFEGYSLKELPLGADRLLPDRVTLFSGPLRRHFPREKELVREIRRTLVHELGHFFGFEEEELRERGWD